MPEEVCAHATELRGNSSAAQDRLQPAYCPLPDYNTCDDGFEDPAVECCSDASASDSEFEDETASSGDDDDAQRPKRSSSGEIVCPPKSGEGKASRFRGVSWDKTKRLWRSQIKVQHLGKSGVSVGYFHTEEEAARAYDRASIGLLGQAVNAAQLNFDRSEYDFDTIPNLKGLPREEIKELLKADRCKTPRRTANNKPRTSRFYGVGATNRRNQWQARIIVDQKVTHLGYYTSQEEAARVYDKVALALHGSNCVQLNYPEHDYDKHEVATLKAKGQVSREELQKHLGVKPMDKSSKFRGVSRKKNKWEAKVMVNRQWKYRELFPTEVEAARAYDLAVRKLKGPEAEAYVNFKEGESDPLKGLSKIVRSSKKLRGIGVDFPPDVCAAQGAALQRRSSLQNCGSVQPYGAIMECRSCHDVAALDMEGMQRPPSGYCHHLRAAEADGPGPSGGPYPGSSPYDMGMQYPQGAPPTPTQRQHAHARMFASPADAVHGPCNAEPIPLAFNSRAPPDGRGASNPFATYSSGMNMECRMPFSSMPEEHGSFCAASQPSPYAVDTSRPQGQSSGPRAGFQAGPLHLYNPEGASGAAEADMYYQGMEGPPQGPPAGSVGLSRHIPDSPPMDLQGSNQSARMNMAVSDTLDGNSNMQQQMNLQLPFSATISSDVPPRLPMFPGDGTRLPSRLSGEQMDGHNSMHAGANGAGNMRDMYSRRMHDCSPQMQQRRTMSHGPMPIPRGRPTSAGMGPGGPSHLSGMRPSSSLYHGYGPRRGPMDYLQGPHMRGPHHGDDYFPPRAPSHEHIDVPWTPFENPDIGPASFGRPDVYGRSYDRGNLRSPMEMLAQKRAFYRSITAPSGHSAQSMHSDPVPYHRSSSLHDRRGSHQGPLQGAHGGLRSSGSFNGSLHQPFNSAERAELYGHMTEAQRLRHLQLQDAQECYKPEPRDRPCMRDSQYGMLAHHSTQEGGAADGQQSLHGSEHGNMHHGHPTQVKVEAELDRQISAHMASVFELFDKQEERASTPYTAGRTDIQHPLQCPLEGREAGVGQAKATTAQGARLGPSSGVELNMPDVINHTLDVLAVDDPFHCDLLSPGLPIPSSAPVGPLREAPRPLSCNEMLPLAGTPCPGTSSAMMMLQDELFDGPGGLFGCPGELFGPPGAPVSSASYDVVHKPISMQEGQPFDTEVFKSLP